MKPVELHFPVGREIQEDYKLWTRQADLFSVTDSKPGLIGHQRQLEMSRFSMFLFSIRQLMPDRVFYQGKLCLLDQRLHLSHVSSDTS